MSSCSIWVYKKEFPTKYIALGLLIFVPLVIQTYVFFTVQKLTKKNSKRKTKGNDFKMLIIIFLLVISLLFKEIELMVKLSADLYPIFHNKWNFHIG